MAETNYSHDDAFSDDQRWHRLLCWLRDAHGTDIGTERMLVKYGSVEGAGRGLFASKSCLPSTTLFTIPAKALINVDTLGPMYISSRRGQMLTATQLISLHLFLHKPREDEDSLDPAFGPYISTMPRNFDSHPLSWLVKSKQSQPQMPETLLLETLPPSVTAALTSLYNRFELDQRAVRIHLRKYPQPAAQSSRPGFSSGSMGGNAFVMDYLWAWLNVNSRCIYYPVRHPSCTEDHLTLCPVLDFANHCSNNSQVIPVMPERSKAPSSTRGNPDDFIFRCSDDNGIEQGQQLFLRYGGHANRTLFVEYGFVVPFQPTEIVTGGFRGEIDVQDLVEDLFSNSRFGRPLRTILEDEGYWGEWTLDSAPPPAHPSYRLITALRLYHLMEDSHFSVQDNLIRPWKDVVNGHRDIISAENEIRWRQSLLGICDNLAKRAKTGLRDASSNLDHGDGCYEWARGNILCLWREELEIAAAVKRSVQAGEEF
ncbi:SET domain-containing protein [Laetiporus sulphureus 93-53]|uniref:SET domain-containing protein n=1 Tax=Laetiporus sulphureus 93-53 TaxID=1314785 RepID=A0A165H7V0_9APHY|nr:SET domain-containing protein [Laetiporus sulphureus 93-53]KZT11365.1 SET domain-containing protein [Laetiporus sulphureus 93-53]